MTHRSYTPTTEQGKPISYLDFVSMMNKNFGGEKVHVPNGNQYDISDTTVKIYRESDSTTTLVLSGKLEGILKAFGSVQEQLGIKLREIGKNGN